MHATAQMAIRRAHVAHHVASPMTLRVTPRKSKKKSGGEIARKTESAAAIVIMSAIGTGTETASAVIALDPDHAVREEIGNARGQGSVIGHENAIGHESVKESVKESEKRIEAALRGETRTGNVKRNASAVPKTATRPQSPDPARPRPRRLLSTRASPLITSFDCAPSTLITSFPRKPSDEDEPVIVDMMELDAGNPAAAVPLTSSAAIERKRSRSPERCPFRPIVSTPFTS